MQAVQAQQQEAGSEVKAPSLLQEADSPPTKKRSPRAGLSGAYIQHLTAVEGGAKNVAG